MNFEDLSAATEISFEIRVLEAVQSGYLLPTRFEQPYEINKYQNERQFILSFHEEWKITHLHRVQAGHNPSTHRENGTRQRDWGQRSDPSACNPP